MDILTLAFLAVIASMTEPKTFCVVFRARNFEILYKCIDLMVEIEDNGATVLISADDFSSGFSVDISCVPLSPSALRNRIMYTGKVGAGKAARSESTTNDEPL